MLAGAAVVAGVACATVCEAGAAGVCAMLTRGNIIAADMPMARLPLPGRGSADPATPGWRKTVLSRANTCRRRRCVGWDMDAMVVFSSSRGRCEGLHSLGNVTWLAWEHK